MCSLSRVVVLMSSNLKHLSNTLDPCQHQLFGSSTNDGEADLSTFRPWDDFTSLLIQKRTKSQH